MLEPVLYTGWQDRIQILAPQLNKLPDLAVGILDLGIPVDHAFSRLPGDHIQVLQEQHPGFVHPVKQFLLGEISFKFIAQMEQIVLIKLLIPVQVR